MQSNAARNEIFHVSVPLRAAVERARERLHPRPHVRPVVQSMTLLKWLSCRP